jgi:hypothetical protein
MAKTENIKIETKKVDETAYITIGKYFREYLESEECRVIKFIPMEIFGANLNTKKPARVKVVLPPEICNTDIRDLRKWSLTIVAVPKKLITHKKKTERDEKDNGKKN